MALLGEVLFGAFAAALASALGPLLLEAVRGHRLSPDAAAVTSALAAAFGGFVAGMMAHRREWVRGVGVGVLLVAYRASLPESAAPSVPPSVSALPAAVVGALVSRWASGPGREEWWSRVRSRAGTAATGVRLAGAGVAAAVLLVPSKASGLLAIGFAGVLMFLFAGFLRAPLGAMATFMEDKCRRRKAEWT
jgi:putative membrane protein (TIGR04086 family)